LDRANWAIGISWIKAHAVIYGNETADQLAKAATRNGDIAVSYSRIPTSTFCSELKEVVMGKWQTDWDKCSKAAITKQFFPKVRDIENENKLKPEFYVLGYWARANQGEPPPVQVNRQCCVSMQQRRPNSRSPNLSVHITPH
jgi:hypothetical protein